MDPVGIEPTPLVLQTSVRTSYTKGPSERYYQLYYRTSYGPDGTRTHTSPLSGTLWNRTTPSYRTILQTAYHTSD